jgi:hypothetical protein
MILVTAETPTIPERWTVAARKPGKGSPIRVKEGSDNGDDCGWGGPTPPVAVRGPPRRDEAASRFPTPPEPLSELFHGSDPIFRERW